MSYMRGRIRPPLPRLDDVNRGLFLEELWRAAHKFDGARTSFTEPGSRHREEMEKVLIVWGLLPPLPDSDKRVRQKPLTSRRPGARLGVRSRF